MRDQKISPIKQGTVIDHIPAKYTYKISKILDIENFEDVTSIASYLSSKKIGKKGIIKVGRLKLKKEDVQKIALVAPNATLCIIKDYKVVEKKNLEIPKELNNIVKCFNPDCITNHENIKSKFIVESYEPLLIRCVYCERKMKKQEIELL